jgi:hypothetical protein
MDAKRCRGARNQVAKIFWRQPRTNCFTRKRRGEKEGKVTVQAGHNGENIRYQLHVDGDEHAKFEAMNMKRNDLIGAMRRENDIEGEKTSVWCQTS